ncbi:MAG: hypothetical protein KA792_08450, partial [Bacteroidales bacterium]|nr:hypothetical protein [Bacteroidales bacterium]
MLKKIYLLLLFTLVIATTLNSQTLRLKVENYNNNLYFDQTIITFVDQATEGFDSKYDAYKLYNTDPEIPNIFSIITDNILSINAIPKLKVDRKVKLGLDYSKNNTLNIIATEINNFETTDVYLLDTILGTYKKLNLMDNYIFSYNTSQTKQRFSICFDFDAVGEPQSTFKTQSEYAEVGTNFTVTFTGIASPSAIFNWDFGEAEIISGSGVGPYILKWSSTGKKTINLSIKETCTKSLKTSFDITVNDALTSAKIFAGGPTTICKGSSVVLSTNAGYGYNYQWKLNGKDITDATNSTYTATEAGAYSLIVTNKVKTYISSNTTINIIDPPKNEITPSGTIFINQNDSTTLYADYDYNYKYQWYKNNSLITGQSKYTIVIKESGSYYVKITNPYDCITTSQTVYVIVLSNNEAQITPLGSTKICPGGFIILQANIGESIAYQWQKNYKDIPGATKDSYSASEPGFYTVIETTPLDQSVSSAIEVTIRDLPVASLYSDKTLICKGDSTSLQDNYRKYFNYKWFFYNYEIIKENDTIFYATQEGYYSVEVSDSCGTDLSDSIYIKVITPFIYLGKDSSICINHSITLDAGIEFKSYLWSNDSTSQTIFIKNDGTWFGTNVYSVIVTDTNNCMASDTILINFDNCNKINNKSSSDIKIININNSGEFYIWSPEKPELITVYNTTGQLVLTNRLSIKQPLTYIQLNP